MTTKPSTRTNTIKHNRRPSNWEVANFWQDSQLVYHIVDDPDDIPDYENAPDWVYKRQGQPIPQSEPTAIQPPATPGIGIPEITPAGQGYIFKYNFATIIVRRLGKSRDDNLVSEIDIEDTPKPQLGIKLNLNSLTARKRLEKEIGIIGGHEAVEVLEDVTRRLMKLYRSGNDVEVISSIDDCQPPKFLVSPFIYEDHPTIFFGEKGVCKSFLALLMGLCVRLPWYDNVFGFDVQDGKSMPVLYLDWERSKSLMQWRIKQISNGHELGLIDISYRRCAAPLADEVDKLSDIIHKEKIKLLVIDSLGLAAGGDINSAESATRFHGALRSLSVTSLIIAQTSKDLSGRKSVFGSTHFQYYSSAVWEVKAGGGEAGELIVGLRNTFCNLSGIHAPIGLKLHFVKKEGDTDASILQISRTDLSKTELSSVLPLRGRIRKLLLEEGKLSPSEIAEALGESEKTIRARLSEDKGKLFTKMIDKTWGAIANEKEGGRLEL
jgi:DNA-binding CsgD family transcriptional regulator